MDVKAGMPYVCAVWIAPELPIKKLPCFGELTGTHADPIQPPRHTRRNVDAVCGFHLDGHSDLKLKPEEVSLRA